MLNLKFSKFHVCGNDYVFMDLFDQNIKNPSEFSKKISNRNFGIGSDGLILIKPSEMADGKMIMFNSDGSIGQMCGNGVSCVGKILCEKFKKNEVIIEVPASKKSIKIKKQNNLFETNMGCPVFLKKPRTLYNSDTYFVCIGNFHCVVFVKDFKNISTTKSKMEDNNFFLNKINIEFAKIINKREIELMVWERGSGKTLACGSGACAAVWIACKNGYLEKNKKIKINFSKGRVFVKFADKNIFLYTNPTKIFEGVIESL